MQPHRITSQKTGVQNKVTVRTSNLAGCDRLSDVRHVIFQVQIGSNGPKHSFFS
jgi:hypothetical protein